MYSKIAPTYEVQEDYDSARKLYHRVYEGRRVLLGAGPAATIRSGAELVAATKRLDLLEKTKALGIWPAANCKSSDDLGHDARMNLLRTIALAMQGRGGYSVAGDLYRTLLFVKVKVRGLKPSRHADRERLHRVALSGREKTLGASHAETLYNMSSIADVLRLQDHYRLAESCILAVVLTYQHKLIEAQEIASRVLETRHRLLGADYPLTMACVNSLVLIPRKQGSYSIAEELNRRTLDACERMLGDNHPSILTAASNLVATLTCRRDYKEAEKLMGRVMRDRETLLGGEDPDTLKSAAIEGRLLYL
ncbi:hypothetical protein IMSHALPRED_001186 [Imshaugia aleurites]|uniref:Kinesin light chain n=1 Tax=Imshaugia aleurites TaxID=172621 RepID=A0A8H3PF71_9LECA|nr:hypothetical protein IMSHALPRED_001186 [Imshaugia aleurites]